MGSLKERFKAKLGKTHSRSSTSGAQPAGNSSTIATPHPQPCTEPSPNTSTSTVSIPDRLWNGAYDLAKVSDASVVDAYERILSVRLHEGGTNISDAPISTDLKSQQNEIATDSEKRRLQMRQLVENGLRRTDNDAKKKEGMEESIQIVMAVKDSVDKALHASPEAAIPWVGICIALEILMNPLTQSSSNRTGIAYVVSRMDWYWNMSSLLLKDSLIDTNSRGTQDELEKVVTRLYSILLLFQMKSVCYYHRGRLSVWLRDTVKLHNWDGELSAIQAAEAAVQADSAQYNTTTIRNRLHEIAQTAEKQNLKLDSIRSAVQEQTMKQEKWHDETADNKCLADLRVTDPRDDKKRIEDTKGGLLKDSYLWILENNQFQEWRNDPQKHLFWIRADPGMGKTMLLCGIIDELQKSLGSADALSYFFCQATDLRINSATAVLRGLIYLLVSQQPSLIAHVRKRYDQAGETLFDDANAFIVLSDIFKGIIQDPNVETCYLMIDALDECVTDLPKLLSLLTDQLELAPRVKCIITSRNLPDIEEWLRRPSDNVKVDLTLSAEYVSTAVRFFIEQRVSTLAQQKRYDQKTHYSVLDHLNSNADSTFLWVALVCQDLEDVPRRNVLSRLKAFPPGLKSLYKRMLQQMRSSDDSSLCKEILAVATVVYRPVTIHELVGLVEALDDLADDLESVREIVSLCGSFLTMREETLYFVHQSAKDFLLNEAFREIFPEGSEVAHRSVFSRSIAVLSRDLRRDIYNLGAPGYLADDVKIPCPDPLKASHYSSINWAKHMSQSIPSSSSSDAVDLREGSPVDRFLRKKFLNWLEALSLDQSISEGIAAIDILRNLIHVCYSRHNPNWLVPPMLTYHKTQSYTSGLRDFIEDGRRFLMSYKTGIEESPLQTYISAMLFSPKNSLTRRAFIHEKPGWITITPDADDNWGACLYTLEGHGRLAVTSVAFSHDSTKIATASDDKTVKIWDVNSGACLQTLEGHELYIRSVAFSHDSKLLASGSKDATVKIWNTSGDCLRTLKGHEDLVVAVAFSSDSSTIAAHALGGPIRIWDVNSGTCIRTLEGSRDLHRSPIAYSSQSSRLASVSRAKTVDIWDTNSGLRVQTLNSCRVESLVAFSPDLTHLALSRANNIQIWDVSGETHERTLEGHKSAVSAVAFSPDSSQLASSSGTDSIKIWDVENGTCLRTLSDPREEIFSLAWSPDSTRLVSGTCSGVPRLWDVRNTPCWPATDQYEIKVKSLAFSHDSIQLATGSESGAVQLWDASSGVCLKTFHGHRLRSLFVAFSHDSTLLVSASGDTTIKVWDVSREACLRTMEGHSAVVRSVAFSDDSNLLASASYDATIRVWDRISGACLQTIQGHGSGFSAVNFSPDSTQLVSGSFNSLVQIWDISSGACLRTLKGHDYWISSAAFSSDSAQIASTSAEGSLKVWDSGTGACLQTCTRFGVAKTMVFDSTGPCVRTDRGLVSLHQPSTPQKANAAAFSHVQWQGLGVSYEGSWITYNGEPVLWLPAEYRPDVSAVSGRKVALGSRTGKLWIYDLDTRQIQGL